MVTTGKPARFPARSLALTFPFLCLLSLSANEKDPIAFVTGPVSPLAPRSQGDQVETCGSLPPCDPESLCANHTSFRGSLCSLLKLLL